MLVRLVRVGWTHRDSRQQTFGQAFELERTCRAVVLGIQSCDEARDLSIGINRAADLEQTELIEVARAKKVPMLYDEGSGRVVDLAKYGFRTAPTIRDVPPPAAMPRSGLSRLSVPLRR